MTTIARAVVELLRHQGASLAVDGDRLHIDGPRGALTPEIVEALRELKPELVAAITDEQRMLSLSLEEFERGHSSIEVSVPWLATTLWWVPRPEHVDELMAEGVARGRIWTARELTDLITLPGLTQPDLVSLAHLKLEFDADVVAVAPDRPEEPSIPTKEPRCCRACRGTRFWVSIHGQEVCATCHPPASPDLVARWIGRDDEASS